MADLGHTLKGIFDTSHVAVSGHKRAAPFKAKYGKVSVKLVDPTKIRDSSLANEEFTDYQIHADFPKLIPRNEIWLGKNISAAERPILVHTALEELRGLSQGLSRSKAYDRALLYQEHLRKKANSYAPSGNVATPKVDPKVYVEKMGVTGEPRMTAWLVDGDLVRDRYKSDGVEGFNCAEDKFVPEGQIWVERDVPPSERLVVALHEYTEYRLMDDDGMRYGPAHDIASRIEFKYRKLGTAPSLGQLSREWVNRELKELKVS
jgi:hypothetical protein